MASIDITDPIVEISVGAILVGTLEIEGILFITNATGLTGVVATMVQTVLVILIVIADIYIFLGAAKHYKAKRGG